MRLIPRCLKCVSVRRLCDFNWNPDLDHDDFSDDVSDAISNEIRIKNASLNFVEEFGWNSQSLVAGAQSLGLSPMAHSLCGNSANGQLILHFLQHLNDDVLQFMHNEKQKSVAGAELVKSTIRYTLLQLESRKSRWPEANLILLNPFALPNAAISFASLLNDIMSTAAPWSPFGSSVLDRLWLAQVIKSTEMCFVTDKSPEYSQSWQFLNRQFEVVACIESSCQFSFAITTTIGNLLRVV